MSGTSVVVVDYGAGNVGSVVRALRHVGADVLVSGDAADVREAERLVLPGVGSFRACMEGLGGLLGALEEAVQGRGVPYLGICLGMQVLGDYGLEGGHCSGLGWVGGHVERLEAPVVPHVGWGALKVVWEHPLLEGVAGHGYFTHSYVLRGASKVVAVADCGGPFAAMVVQRSVAGVQFHPEKSQGAGLRLLRNFLVWKP